MAQIRGSNELLLYLDFDGVLHHENVHWHPLVGAYLSAPFEFKLFQHIHLLEELLRPYPRIQIVLSTSWVRQHGVTKAAKNLPPSLRPRVIGATFNPRMDPDVFYAKPRGQQVWDDVLKRKPLNWLALDDNAEGWPPESAGKFIKTHLHHGISEPEVLAEFKLRLGEMARA